MCRNDFDKLEVTKQVEYINRAIKENEKTVKEICAEIEIGHGTLSDRFKKINYRFDRNSKQYLLKKETGSSSKRKKSKHVVTEKTNTHKCVGLGKRINTNISLNVDLKKQLQVYGIMHDKTLSDILNEAGQKYLNECN